MTNFWIDSKLIEDDVIQIQCRSMSDPPLSDIDFKNKMAWVWIIVKSESQPRDQSINELNRDSRMYFG